MNAARNKRSETLQRIRSLIQKDGFDRALAACDRYLGADPEDLDILLLKSEILSSPMPEVHDAALAISTLEQAHDIYPREFRVLECLGQAYEAAGDYEAAARRYEAAIELDDSSGTSYYALACLFEAPGIDMSIETAIEHLRSAFALMPQDWQVSRDLGRLHWRLGDLGRAEASYEVALGVDPPPDPSSQRQILGWLRRIRRGSAYDPGYQDVLKQ